METSLERIQGKISELEAQINDLRIAERELLALDHESPRQVKPTSTGASAPAKAAPAARAKPGPKAKQKPAAAAAQPKAQEPSGKPESISSAVAQALAEHDPLSVGEIADLITASGREINNRAISFTLQALKKRGIAKSVDGKWTSAAAKSRSKKASASAKGAAEALEA
jgi:hypothetical protein